MNLAIAIAVGAAAANFAVAAMHLAISRAPGRGIRRLFAAIALTAGLYNATSAVFATAGLADAVYLAAGRAAYCIAVVHTVLWLLYAYAAPGVSLRRLPAAVRWLAISSLAVALGLAITGGLLQRKVTIVEITWANVRYAYPVTTTLGNVYGLLAIGLPVLVFSRFLQRYRRGERTLRWHVWFFGLFLLCALDEVLVANRVVSLPSFLDIGMLLVVFPLSLQTIRQVIEDARRLEQLSNHLEAEVGRRPQDSERSPKALNDTNQRFGDLVSSLNAVIWEADPKTWALTFVSTGAERLLGYPLDEWRHGEEFWARHLHPADRERTTAAAKAAFHSGTVTSLEYRMLTADGRVRWLHDFIHPVPASAGRPERVRGIIVDVTESRHAHEALLESEQRFRSLFEEIPLGIYRTSPEGRILMANPALIRLLGYSSFEELANLDLEAMAVGPCYPRAAFRETIESQGAVWGLESEWRQLDGSVIFVRESARAVRDPGGGISFYDGIVEDITERRRAELALRASEERYRTVVQDHTETICRMNADGVFTFVNEVYCRFFGKTPEQLLGSRWQSVAVPDDLPVVESKLRELSPENPVVVVENRVFSGDGQVRWMQFANRGTFDDQGALVEFQSVGRDISERVAAAERLRESEERFQQVADHAGVFVWEVDVDGLFTHASSFAEKILGYTPEELVGKLHYYDLYPASLLDELKAQAVAKFARKAPFESFLSPNVTKTGGLVLLETTGVPLLDQAGNLRGYRGAHRDVTDRKRSEAALRETRSTIQRQLHEIEAIYAGAPIGLCVVDIEMRIARMNDRLAQISGLPVDAHLGRGIREALPDLAPQLEPMWRRVMDTGEPLLEQEVRGTTPAQPGVERVWLVSQYPLKAADDRVVALNVVVQEITDRKRAEAALIESEQRFRSLADSAPVIIWVSNSAGEVEFFNRQAITFTGRTFEQLDGVDWPEVIHPEDAERVRSAHAAALEAQSSGQIELRLKCADGQYRWVLATAIARLTGSEFAGHIGTIIDITDLKHDQQQMVASQKLESLGVLAGGVAHDFNNLLGGIVADADLASTELDDGSPVRESIDRIRRVAFRASEIVRQLMAYSGQEIPELQPVDLGSVIVDMAELLKVSISKHAALELDLPNGIPAVRASASQLRQVVMNLITNASEAIGDRPGVIRVAISRAAVSRSELLGAADLPPGDYVRLNVSDTGCGMAPEVCARVFDPFFTTKFPGRGMGLAAVHGIVRLHRGTIRVASTIGEGTSFDVLLPATAESAVPPSHGPDRPFAVSPDVVSRGAVLMIEDEESLRVAVCKMLRKKGFTVIEADDGASAVEIFRAGRSGIGVVLLDLTLPGLSGREVLAELRRLRPEVKVIVTTAYNRDTAAAALGSDGEWSFIRKPYRLADLTQLLRRTLLT